jgi:hypothetical protein
MLHFIQDAISGCLSPAHYPLIYDMLKRDIKNHGGTSLVLGVFFIVLGLYFVVLTLWWPTMRYELDREALTLLYGSAIKYRIPLDTIRSIKRVDLSLALWSSLRMPGVALFSVPYSDVGQVRMCSTSLH